MEFEAIRDSHRFPFPPPACADVPRFLRLRSGDYLHDSVFEVHIGRLGGPMMLSLGLASTFLGLNDDDTGIPMASIS